MPSKCQGLLLLLGVVLSVHGYEFDMVFQTKCIMEDGVDASSISGTYVAFDRNNPADSILLDARFEDPNGIVVYEKRGVTASDFDIKVGKEGEYKLCFTTKDYATAQRTRVRMTWRTGASATDWDAVAKKDNLNSIQTEILKLERTVKDIHLELQYIRRTEEQMRHVNEATNARVAWFSISLLIVCVGLSVWQLYLLRRFFQRKKLL